MDHVELQDLVGGELQEAFAKSFKKVIDNLQDINTKYKDKRKITITIGFTQNELRNDVAVDITVTEKLASLSPMKTNFWMERDLKTGETVATEYGRQIKGQMSIDDYAPRQVVDGKEVDTDTGEVIEDRVVDFRKVSES